jgi:hypothetical protein
MSLIGRLKGWVPPPKKTDPDFGQILFMHMAGNPAASYWEAEWTFPKTGTMISIALPGDEWGPYPESREFYLRLPERFDEILRAVRPVLDSVFRTRLGVDLPADIFCAVKLGGFGLENPRVQPIEWDMEFETLGDEWLGITIPFVGNSPRAPVVDT